MTPSGAERGRASVGRYLIAAGMVLLAFFVSYGYATARSDVPALAEDDSVLAGFDDQDAGCACCDTGDVEAVEGETTIAEGAQTIFVDAASGYSPNLIRAVAGVPIEMTFSEEDGCMAEVLFPDFGILEDLTQGGTVISLPALKPGKYGFSCGMRMVFGTLVVE